MIKGITHVIFDHNNPDNTELTRNFRDITGETQTLTRLPGGVIIKIRETADQPPHKVAPMAPAENDKTINTTLEANYNQSTKFREIT